MTAPQWWTDAIEAGAMPLAVVKAHGVWHNLDEANRAIVMKACIGQAEAVLAAALSVVLEAVAQRIDAIHGLPDGVESRYPEVAAFRDAAEIVRGFAQEVQQ